MMLLLQIAAETHPLTGTAAEWVWLLPVLPLLGFVINGLLSLAPAYHPGPSDPDVMGHGHGKDELAEASHAESADEGGAHGDDHHAVKPHRYARIVSIVGPLVLALSFGIAFAIFGAMRSVNMEAPFIKTFFSWISSRW
jgi:hypothetical protein